jgi:aminoglycoside phosphotransferase (APT) family kinase protein
MNQRRACPSERDAAAIAAELHGREPLSVRRFPMGIGHWVYDVRGASGEELVVRIGAIDQAPDFAGALYWSKLLRPRGVPLPQLLQAGSWQDFPYMVMERLPGEDLGLAYPSLQLEQKQAIAGDIVRIQELVGALGEGPGFGFVRLPDSPRRPSWRHVIDDSLMRSRQRMESAGVSLPSSVDRLVQSARGFDAYFARVRPLPFLDDTTTKNVLVRDGALTGIVDVDWVCFGDRLLTVALTRASLLGSNRDEAYTDHWCKLLALTPRQQAVVRLYTALFFLDFMSELGHRFNRDSSTITLAEFARLEALLEAELHDL